MERPTALPHSARDDRGVAVGRGGTAVRNVSSEAVVFSTGEHRRNTLLQPKPHPTLYGAVLRISARVTVCLCSRGETSVIAVN